MVADERPMLLCRVHIPVGMQADVDAWMPKHFDDSLRHPACTAAANYVVLHDWGRVPAAFETECTRFIPYVADGVSGLLDWVNGPELRAAIEDGVEREGKYPTLDDEPFNGTIVVPVQVRGATGREFAGRGPILVERFDVEEPDAEEFDHWLDGRHLDEASSWPEVVRARTCRAVADIPQVWPYTRYQGKGNRMLIVEFAEGADIRAVASSRAVRDWLLDSLPWDARLHYVKREIAENVLIRTKADLV